MLKRLLALTVFLVLGTTALMVKMPSARAQVPCLPVTPLSTACAPISAILCPDQLNGLLSRAFYSQYYSAANPYFVNYYGRPYPVYNSLFYNIPYPAVVNFDANGAITFVQQISNSGLCAPPPAPTAVPAPAIATPVVVTQIVREVVVPAKAGILPPKTGDAGLAGE